MMMPCVEKIKQVPICVQKINDEMPNELKIKFCNNLDSDIKPLDLSAINKEPDLQINLKDEQSKSDVISISSDNSSQEIVKTSAKIKRNTKKSLSKKKNGKNIICKTNEFTEKKSPRKLPQNFLDTPKILKNKKNIKSKTETKNIISYDDDDQLECKTEEKPRRKFTISTNLKKISFKNHPPSQTKIETYFIKTPKTNTIGYFETFEKSTKCQSKNAKSTIENVDAFLGVLSEEANIKVELEPTSYSNEIENEIVENISVGSYNFKEEKPYSLNIDYKNKMKKQIENVVTGENYSDQFKEVLLLDEIEIIENQNISVGSYHFKEEKPYSLNIYDKNERKEQIENIVTVENYPDPFKEVPLLEIAHNQHLKCNYQESTDHDSFQNKLKSNISSKSYSLSETALVHRQSSLRRSIESTNTEKSEILKVQKSKKARKRLSFKSKSSIEESTHCKNFSSSVSLFTNSEILESTSSIYNNRKRKKEYKENSLPVIDKIICLIDDDLEEIEKEKFNKIQGNSELIKRNRIISKNECITEQKKSFGKRKCIECPSYKVVDGTTFAVDAFRFGYIEDVTHYFLTHYHGDHYIGLKKSFSQPIYMSAITARLVETFIHVNSEYLNVIDLNETVIINGIEITAIDANHCPGAVMFAFKFPNGNVTLHTGDFRASFEMESNSYFWNNQIDTIYLDTTYLNKNYDFKSQSESIEDVIECIRNFQEKHIGKKILYVCGSYVIGKEKVWAAIAEFTGEFVYTEGNRLKALKSIGDIELIKYIVSDPKVAAIHVRTMGELFYDKLCEYWKLYEEDFDIILAIRPSGWERNSKPQYRGKINIIGIEYSEHSSCSEMRRFIRFLQPKKIISTVPFGTDLSKTCQIPISWFDNQVKPKRKAYQSSITNFTNSEKKSKSKEQIEIEKPTCSKYLNGSQYETCVSPIKSRTTNSVKSPFKSIKNVKKLYETINDWIS